MWRCADDTKLYCLLPSRGSWELVSNPSPLPNRLGVVNTKSNTLPRCKAMKDFINGRWKGVGFSQQEYIPSSCSAIPLSPFAWTQHTKCQATIILFGDSHIRNLFTAIVYGLRGIESFAEGHTDSEEKAIGIALSHQWRLYHNGTASDHIIVHSDVKYHNPQLFNDCPCNDEVKKCLRDPLPKIVVSDSPLPDIVVSGREAISVPDLVLLRDHHESMMTMAI